MAHLCDFCEASATHLVFPLQQPQDGPVTFFYACTPHLTHDGRPGRRQRPCQRLPAFGLTGESVHGTPSRDVTS